MAVADRPQALEVADGRNEDAGRPRHRLDDHGGDGRCVVQRHQPLEPVSEVRAPLRLSARECVVFEVMGVRQMIDPRQQCSKELAIADDAADRSAAETDPVIATLASDQPGARGFTAQTVVGDRDLERGIDGFRAGVGEEHPIEITGQQDAEPRRRLECARMAHLKPRHIVETRDLVAHRLHDLGVGVAGIAAPEAGGSIEDFAAIM
jgi:hypothetical protein